MSESQQVPDLSHEQACNTLVENVHVPVFFSQLAQDYRVVPQNEQEAHQRVELSHRLRAAHSEELSKSAGHRNEFLTTADQLLSGEQEQPADVDIVKQAAAELAANPLIREASLTHQDNIAANILAEQFNQDK